MSQETVKVRLLNREYQFACKEGERATLLNAADHLDQTMREIKSNNNTMTSDKIALMAAMNISHDLVKSKSINHTFDTEVMGKVKKINDKLEHLLESDL